MTRGKYIVIEGQDGTGKSTQVARLMERLRRGGIECIEFHEPGEADEALDTMPNKIRQLIKNAAIKRVASTNIALFSSARNELWKRPGGASDALKAGKWVIAARNWHSTLAYQGYGEGEDLGAIETITKTMVGEDYLSPDYECILCLPEKDRLDRTTKRDNKSAEDTFESKASDFQVRVNDSYFKIAEQFKLDTINGEGSEKEVETKITEAMQKKLKITV